MPNRMLRDWTHSSKVKSLSAPEERMFIRLIMKADDHGCFYAESRLLNSHCFPRLDNIRDSDITHWMDALQKVGLIVVYEHDGERYMQICEFRQRLDKAQSKYPLPTRCPSSTLVPGPLPRSRTETEEKGNNTPDGVPGSSPPVVDKKEIFGRILKTKKVLYQFIAEYRPDFIEPYVELWNLFAGERKKAQISKVSESRRRKFNTRIREKSFDFLAILVKAGAAGDFLSTSKWFTWDWIMDSEANYLKVIEGNYDKGDKPKAPPAEKPGKPKVLEKTQEELNYLFGMFCEGNLTVISLYPEHYDFLKKNCGILFTDLQVEEIKQKAEGYCKQKEIEWNDANQKKYMKLYGVMEFFNHHHETNGTGAIFQL